MAHDRLEGDMDRFYGLLEALRDSLGGYRRLADCNGKMGWPVGGVDYFFEDGEMRRDIPEMRRVVRVGTHALTATSNTTLWSRLKQHKGSGHGGGNHRGSIFRAHIGTALI